MLNKPAPLNMTTIARYLPLLAALLVLPAHAGQLAGRVVSVADGDTLTLLVDRKQIRVRLAEIDAPESKPSAHGRNNPRQPFATARTPRYRTPGVIATAVSLARLPALGSMPTPNRCGVGLAQCIYLVSPITDLTALSIR